MSFYDKIIPKQNLDLTKLDLFFFLLNKTIIIGLMILFLVYFFNSKIIRTICHFTDSGHKIRTADRQARCVEWLCSQSRGVAFM